MDPAEEAERMLGTVRNVESELATARNKVTKHRNHLEKRGVTEDDIQAAKAELASLAHAIDVAADGLESVSEPVEE
jgi:predicted  nucleic acid-binding Zn-ribbon protein